jgi:hypothetical protein
MHFSYVLVDEDRIPVGIDHDEAAGSGIAFQGFLLRPETGFFQGTVYLAHILVLLQGFTLLIPAGIVMR